MQSTVQGLNPLVNCVNVETQERLKTYRLLCDARLESLIPLPEGLSAPLLQAMRYSALAPGKRLRPLLCMAAAEAVGGTAQAVENAASSLELVHCFSLIHDDLPAIDDDNLRRGRPTCHVQFGEATAILAGDALFALAFQALSENPGPADRVLRSVRSLALATGVDGLVAGEIVDVLTEGKPFDEATLTYIHSRKTGALIASACEIGALLGGGTDDQVAAIRRFGDAVGLAFQIADDILNETGTAEALGKAIGSDRDRGKATYPALFGLEGARTAARRLTAQALDALPPGLTQPDVLIALAESAIHRDS